MKDPLINCIIGKIPNEITGLGFFEDTQENFGRNVSSIFISKNEGITGIIAVVFFFMETQSDFLNPLTSHLRYKSSFFFLKSLLK